MMAFLNSGIWQGNFLDLWSIPHTLIGIIIALIAIRYGWTISNTLFLLLVITVGWELFETYFQINEVITNRITDIILSFIGYGVTIISFKSLGVSANMDRLDTAIYGIIGFYILSNIIGWLAYHQYTT